MRNSATTPRQLALIMSPDERLFSEQLGKALAQARNAAMLTQQQVADNLAIPQPQYASYEVGRRRVPVSMLPRLARLLNVSVEALIGEDATAAAPIPERRSRRGPPSRLEQQLDAIARLPKTEQRAVSTLLTAVLAQHSAPVPAE